MTMTSAANDAVRFQNNVTSISRAYTGAEQEFIQNPQAFSDSTPGIGGTASIGISPGLKNLFPLALVFAIVLYIVFKA